MLALIAAALALQAPAARPDLGWLAGHWVSCAAGTDIIEHWGRRRAGWILGLRLFGRGPAAARDGMRIGPASGGRPGALSLYRQEMAADAAEYPLVDARGTMAVFFNPRLFPSRLIYRREGRRLIARAEIIVPNDPLNGAEFVYDPAGPGSPCPRGGGRPAEAGE